MWVEGLNPRSPPTWPCARDLSFQIGDRGSLWTCNNSPEESYNLPNTTLQTLHHGNTYRSLHTLAWDRLGKRKHAGSTRSFFITWNKAGSVAAHMELLGLERRKLKPLVYDEVVRKDLKLLEVDEDLLLQIQNDKWGVSEACLVQYTSSRVASFQGPTDSTRRCWVSSMHCVILKTRSSFQNVASLQSLTVRPPYDAKTILLQPFTGSSLRALLHWKQCFVQNHRPLHCGWWKQQIRSYWLQLIRCIDA